MEKSNYRCKFTWLSVTKSRTHPRAFSLLQTHLTIRHPPPPPTHTEIVFDIFFMIHIFVEYINRPTTHPLLPCLNIFFISLGGGAMWLQK